MKNLCENSNEIREVIDSMVANQISINEFVLNALITQLLIEGKSNEVQLVIDVEFEKFKLTPNEKTERLMQQFQLDKMQQLLEEEGKESSMNYLKESIANGQANSINCNWGVARLCANSTESREIIELMKKHCIFIDPRTLNILVKELLYVSKMKNEM